MLYDRQKQVKCKYNWGDPIGQTGDFIRRRAFTQIRDKYYINIINS